jgi:hypothetical protein
VVNLRQQIIAAWPTEFPKPTATSLWRWLDKAAKGNLIRVTGSGRKNEPFRYCLGQPI